MRTLGNDELRKRIEEIGTDELAPGQRAAVQELLGALANAFPGDRGDLEMVVRETVESLAYGERGKPGFPREPLFRFSAYRGLADPPVNRIPALLERRRGGARTCVTNCGESHRVLEPARRGGVARFV